MKVTINGRVESVDCGTTVGSLLQGLKLEPIRVAVEVNEELVTRREYGCTVLRDGDRLEIVTFVGGG